MKLAREQLDLRARHPDFQRFLDINEQHSARVVAQVPCALDEAYGPASLQRMDVFPAQASGAPVLVFIHGGYWRALDKRSYRFTAEPFVEAGFAVFVLNYRLIPAVTMEDLVGDIDEALRWIGREGPRFGADPSALTIAGHSAGGHLALMAYLRNEALRPSIRALCSLSGIFDLEPIRGSYLDEVLQLTESDVALHSPARLDLGVVTCPTMLAVGAGETEFFIEQSRRLHEDNRDNAAFEYLACPSLNHYQVVHELGRADSAVSRFILTHGKT
ncbi:MAG: alpha/beta hydrolase [Myxococcota bacterium]